MTEIEKLQSGDYYRMDDAEIAVIHHRAVALFQEYNSVSITDKNRRDSILRKLFGSVGINPSVKPGFFCDLGMNIHVGDDFLTNYNVTILDMAPVTIGNNVWIGPNVGIFAVSHPIEAAGREKTLAIAQPITIGDNVWIGGNSVVLMGVNIGRNVIIGAGSVVTHDIPDNAMAVGNPAKVIKYINNQD